MGDVDAGLAELATADWRLVVIDTLTWVHAANHGECVGYVMHTRHRAWCSNCGWRAAARDDDTPDAIAVFALGCVAAFGKAAGIAAVVGEDEELRAGWLEAERLAEKFDNGDTEDA